PRVSIILLKSTIVIYNRFWVLQDIINRYSIFFFNFDRFITAMKNEDFPTFSEFYTYVETMKKKSLTVDGLIPAEMLAKTLVF
ncbi:hypothetical protein PT043_08950, partial [Erysipelothrix rhusiopathiae]|nr:hypothetical protein [Erysipelothrix rhusiopathiae]